MNTQNTEMFKEIAQYLDSQNIRHCLLGYNYLIACISLLIYNPSSIKKITDVYEQVGQVYSADIKNIDRGIRTALKDTHQKNKEFMSKAADEIRYKVFIGEDKTNNDSDWPWQIQKILQRRRVVLYKNRRQSYQFRHNIKNETVTGHI